MTNKTSAEGIVAVGKWLLFALVLSALTPREYSQLTPVAGVPPEQRLWLARIANGVSKTDPAEEQQLSQACGIKPTVGGAVYSAWKACRARNLKPLRYEIAALHAAPNELSPVLAHVFEERIVQPDHVVAFRWTVETTARPGVPLPWPEASRAFDYGLHIAGVQRSGDWIRLLDSVPADGWLRINTVPAARDDDPLHVYVRPLNGEVLNVEALVAARPDGRTQQIAAGSYFIQKVTGGVVEFRAEIPSDFACGAKVVDPKPLPPTLRARASEFFNRSGAPKFSLKYSKGC